MKQCKEKIKTPLIPALPPLFSFFHLSYFNWKMATENDFSCLYREFKVKVTFRVVKLNVGKNYSQDYKGPFQTKYIIIVHAE